MGAHLGTYLTAQHKTPKVTTRYSKERFSIVVSVWNWVNIYLQQSGGGGAPTCAQPLILARYYLSSQGMTDPHKVYIYIHTWSPKHPMFSGCLVKQPSPKQRFGIIQLKQPFFMDVSGSRYIKGIIYIYHETSFISDYTVKIMATTSLQAF